MYLSHLFSTANSSSKLQWMKTGCIPWYHQKKFSPCQKFFLFWNAECIVIWDHGDTLDIYRDSTRTCHCNTHWKLYDYSNGKLLWWKLWDFSKLVCRYWLLRAVNIYTLDAWYQVSRVKVPCPHLKWPEYTCPGLCVLSP